MQLDAATLSTPLSTSIAREALSVQSMPELARLLRQLRGRDAGRQRAGSRDGAEWTYRELAATLGCSHAAIGEYFTGATLPPTDRFDQLVWFLGASQAERNHLARARDRVAERRRRPRSSPVPEAGVGGAANVPRELPARWPDLVGRRSQLQTLDRISATDAAGLAIAAICGGPGVGKTALAVHWAHRVADRFPDGQLYLDLRGCATSEPVGPHDALGRFLRTLGVPPRCLPPAVEQRATQFRTMLAGRRMLVVLDDAASAEQVRPLLPGGPACMVVVTSRDALSGLVAAEGAGRVVLDVLTDAEAWSLARTLLGDRPDVASEDVRTLIRLCGRLPLALRLACERAASRPGLPMAELVVALGGPTHAVTCSTPLTPAAVCSRGCQV
jgi:Helix-turn-helix domain/NB-ARC domain